jgi:hypothetical protein
MTSNAGLPLTRQIPSPLVIWLVSMAAGLTVFFLAIFIQWLIYDDWLHDSGPLRIVGSALAGALMFAVAFRWQLTLRQRRLEILHRFETIRWMNDRIRNSLQAIECVTYASAPEATGQVRSAVDAIESVLHEVLTGANAPPSRQAQSNTEPHAESIVTH